jgi:hypothetical protein
MSNLLHWIRRIPSVFVRIGVVITCGALCVAGTASCSSGQTSEVVVDEKVLLVPQVRAGWVGWCALLQHGGGCEASGHSPILVETWGGASPPPVTEGMALTTRQVAALAIYQGHGLSIHPRRVRYVPWRRWHAISTRTEPTLPDGLRVAVVQLRGLFIRPSMLPPRFVPVNASGKPLAETANPEAIGVETPTRHVSATATTSTGPCRIGALHLHGVLAFGAYVILRASSHRGLIGRPFMSCASTLYELAGWRVTAAVLLDAVKPGAVPAMLPNMQPVPRHHGVFQALCSEGEMVARRIPGAWLVATGGNGLQQRLMVLEHLKASVHIG